MSDPVRPQLGRRDLLRRALTGTAVLGAATAAGSLAPGTAAATTGTAGTTAAPTAVPAAAIAVQPSQPCGFAYTVPIDAQNMGAYAQPGALVAVSQYQMPNSRFLADGGCCVLIYDDQLVEGARLTGQALDDHLEGLVSQWPWAGGFFADELGTSNGYGVDYDTCVAIAQGFRDVADRHGMIVIHNGPWERTSNAGAGGYPDPDRNGCSLGDGVCIEQVAYAQFWQDLVDGPQWRHPGLAMVIVTDDAQRDPWLGHASHVVTQQTYDLPPAPWGPFTDTGLPHGTG